MRRKEKRKKGKVRVWGMTRRGKEELALGTDTKENEPGVGGITFMVFLFLELSRVVGGNSPPNTVAFTV